MRDWSKLDVVEITADCPGYDDPEDLGLLGVQFEGRCLYIAADAYGAAEFIWILTGDRVRLVPNVSRHSGESWAVEPQTGIAA